MVVLRKAQRREINLRVGLLGAAGDGKTYTALAVAHHLANLQGLPPDKIGVVDSEVSLSAKREQVASAEKYVGEACRCVDCQGHGLSFGEFQLACLDPGSRRPQDYCEALAALRAAQCQIVVIDSISHEWEACLQMVDDASAQNKWAQGWSKVTPLHDRFIADMMAYPGHLLATMRGKEKHEQAKEGGKKVIRSKGVQPIQRPGILFEFDVALFLQKARAIVIKTRAAQLADRAFDRPGSELARALNAWANGSTGQSVAEWRRARFLELAGELEDEDRKAAALEWAQSAGSEDLEKAIERMRK